MNLVQWQKINGNFSKLTLQHNQAQILFIDLEEFDDEVTMFKSILSADELARTQKFKFEADRKRFILARGMLRFIIHAQTGLKPSLIKFNNNSYGKPELQKEQNVASIQFSVSHSENGLCLGLVQKLNIGVDIELLKPAPDLKNLAEKYFSETEFGQISNLSGSDLVEGFYNCWTRKEAVVKALGVGLSFPLKDFDVSLIPGEAPKIIGARGASGDQLKHLRLDTFKFGSYFIGAAALDNNIEKINYFHVDSSYQLMSELKLILK